MLYKFPCPTQHNIFISNLGKKRNIWFSNEANGMTEIFIFINFRYFHSTKPKNGKYLTKFSGRINGCVIKTKYEATNVELF